MAVIKYLGGRVSAPLVNLTVLGTAVPATMHAYADIPFAKSFSAMGKAMDLYRQYLWGDRTKMEPWQVAMIDAIRDKGWHTAQFNREALSTLQNKIGRGWDTLVDLSMWGFGKTEELIRVASIAGTYIALREQQGAGFNHDKALATSKTVSDKANATYGKATYPYLARGQNIAAQIVKMFYVFSKFSHNYLQTMADIGVNKRDYKALMWMATAPAILSGVGAGVGFPYIMRAIGKLVGSDEPEEDFYDWLEETLGESVSNTARFGLFGVAGRGASLKGSLQIGSTSIPSEMSIIDLLGAPGSIVGDLYDGTKLIYRGDIYKGTEKMMPLAVGNIMKGIRERTQGLTTYNNSPIFYGTKPVKSDNLEMVLRALSFNPARIAKIKEEQYTEHRISEKYKKMKEDIYSQVKAFYGRPPEERTRLNWMPILEDITAFNARVQERHITSMVPPITKESMKQMLRRSQRPNKREKARAATMDRD